jgi:uncharacterized protein YtpQ (UPF0354 family)
MPFWNFGTKRNSLSKTPPPERMLSPDCSQDEFVLLFCKLLQDRLPDARLTHQPPMTVLIQLSVDAPGTMKLNLENLWRQIHRVGDGRRELIERHLNLAIPSAQPPQKLDKHQILPNIRDSQYLSQLGPKSVTEHLVADLWILYVVDWPDKLVGLTTENVESLAIGQNNLRQIAIENLKRTVSPIQCRKMGSWSRLVAGGTYEASILLLDDFWEQQVNTVRGDLVAAAPSRDVLLFTDSSSREGLAAVRQHVAHITTKGHYVVSSTLLRRRDGRWIAFD